MPSSPINNKSVCLFKVFLKQRLDIFPYFLTKNTNADTIVFLILLLSLILTVILMSLKSSSLAQTPFKAFIIINALSINQTFLEGLNLLVSWYNYCHLRLHTSNISSVVYGWINNPRWTFSKRFLYVWYNLQLFNSNTLSIWLSLTTVSAFEDK